MIRIVTVGESIFFVIKISNTNGTEKIKAVHWIRGIFNQKNTETNVLYF